MNVLTVKFLVFFTKNFTVRTFIFIFLNSGQNNFFLIFQPRPEICWFSFVGLSYQLRGKNKETAAERL